MLLDGHTASSVAKRLGLSGTNILSRWKGEQLAQSDPVASALQSRKEALWPRLPHTHPIRKPQTLAKIRE